MRTLVMCWPCGIGDGLDYSQESGGYGTQVGCHELAYSRAVRMSKLAGISKHWAAGVDLISNKVNKPYTNCTCEKQVEDEALRRRQALPSKMLHNGGKNPHESDIMKPTFMRSVIEYRRATIANAQFID
jgi:hypothetical protein